LASLERLQENYSKLPDTLMGRSPSGSLHHYFKHPGPEFKVKSLDNFIVGYPGIDCKGDGGMVVAPPTKRSDGGVYEWVNDLPIAEAPQWLLAMVTETATQPDDPTDDDDAEMSVEEAMAAVEVIPNDDLEWNDWNDRGMAIFRATGGKGFAAFDTLSQKSSKYHARRTLEKWRAYYTSPPKEIGAGSLIYWANEADPEWRVRYTKKVFDDLAGNNAQPQSNDDNAPAGKQDKQQAQDNKPQAQGKQQAQAQAPAWPVLGADALHGLAGEVVALFEPHTEADPVAILMQFLVYFGSVIDRYTHYLVESDRHHGNLFALLVGETSKARKGTSAGRLRQLMESVDQDWCSNCVKGGLSSGEGLIWEIRDQVTGPPGKDGEDKVIVNGVDDKRLMLDEREFYSALTVMKREGNIVSRIVRDGWDGRPLMSMTKNNPARCGKPHISICGHITDSELRRNLDDTSMANGYANRFLFACVRRSKELPFGGNLDPAAIDALGVKIHERYAEIYGVEKAITMNEQARKMWAREYHELSMGKPGLFGAAIARGEAQVIRLALLYAVLDGSDQIKLPHLKAAFAVWRYCEASARYIFGDSVGDPVADTLFRALRSSSGGMTRTELHKLFGRNLPAVKIEAALARLQEYGLVRHETQSPGPKGGPPTERWHAV
jgi:hypothetical protein